MSTPKPVVIPAPPAPPAPLPAEINPDSQAAADETARKAKERQQAGVTATGTILTSGLDDDDKITKKNNLGA